MNRQQALDQLRVMQAWHEDFGNGPCPDYDAICYAIGVIEEAPEGLDNLIKALEDEHKKLLEMQKALKNVPDTNVGDTISRQAAIDALNDAVHEHNITDFDAVATILALPSVTPKQRTGKWIPVTERLPEDYQDVLICGEGDFITCAQLIKGIFECGERELYGSIDGTKVIGADTFNVLAWMPLPEPYRHEGEAE